MLTKATAKVLVLLGLLLSSTLVLIPDAHAGRSCEPRKITPTELVNASRLASQLLTKLNASKNRVVLVARVGADLSDHNLRYSHVGVAYRTKPDYWEFIHLLNQCGASTSALYRQGLTTFFLDDVFAWDALVLEPTPTLQRALAAQLRAHAGRPIHHPQYSMLAYPFSAEYQNSNQWVLELLASAHSKHRKRPMIQAWLEQQGYRGSIVRISAIQRLGGSLFKANVAFFDHPRSARLKGKYEVVTVKSVEQFMQRKKWLQRRWRVQLPSTSK